MISQRELFLNYLGQTSENPYAIEIERAEGVYMYGPNDKKYIDLIAGVSVSSLGHNFEPVKQAIIKQLDKHLHLMVYGEFIQAPQVKLAKYLCDLLPQQINSVYLVNSGSEAIDAALKLAKRYTGKTKIFGFKNAYHGSTHGALSLCGNEDFKRSFRPLLPDTYHLELNNYDQLKLIDHKTACVVIEPIQAEAGVQIPERAYVQLLRELCNKNNCLLIVDEIQTGFGRTGKMFGFEHFDIIPDIVCFAKALGGGMPIGAIASPKNIMDAFKTNPVLGHITTFGGHPLSSVAALAAIQYINENHLAEKANENEIIFRENLVHPKINQIRGKGLLLAVEIGSFDNVMKFIKIGIDKGFITDWFVFYDTAFRIAPPLNITKEEIIISCNLIKEALNQI
jgi:acetylornithine/succinyldiaminopimelate/putrescine aminotransferase